MPTGNVKTDDYGHLHFTFDDGTYATVYWAPTGELGDGQGGEYDEASIEHNTKLSGAELVALAYANTGPNKGKYDHSNDTFEIVQPVKYPTSHELARKLLELPDLPLELALGCAHDTVLSSDSDEPEVPEVTVTHSSERVQLFSFIGGGNFSWEQ